MREHPFVVKFSAHIGLQRIIINILLKNILMKMKTSIIFRNIDGTPSILLAPVNLHQMYKPALPIMELHRKQRPSPRIRQPAYVRVQTTKEAALAGHLETHYPLRSGKKAGFTHLPAHVRRSNHLYAVYWINYPHLRCFAYRFASL